MTFFSFIITCICTCVPKYNLFGLYVTCMGVFSGPTIWYCINTWCALPVEDYLLLSAFLTACSFCVELMSCGLSHFHLGMSMLLLLFSSCLGMAGHVGEIFWVQLLTLLGDTVSQKTSWSSGCYNLSNPSSGMFPEPKMWTLFCRWIQWNWAPQLCISLEDICFSLTSSWSPNVTFQLGNEIRIWGNDKWLWKPVSDEAQHQRSRDWRTAKHVYPDDEEVS